MGWGRVEQHEMIVGPIRRRGHVCGGLDVT
jgi:hypothetical protein